MTPQENAEFLNRKHPFFPGMNILFSGGYASMKLQQHSDASSEFREV